MLRDFLKIYFYYQNLIFCLNIVIGQSSLEDFYVGNVKNKILSPYDKEASTSSDQKFRLRGINRTFGSGRLEIYYRDKWNLVCDKYFTQKAGEVVCKSLGFDRGLSTLKTNSAFGNGKLTDFIPYVFSCNGSESSLFSCQKVLKSIYCNPVTDAVGLECQQNYESMCDKDGILYGKICYHSFQNQLSNFDDASVKCDQIGGSLAFVRNQEEMDFISELLFATAPKGDKQWYIGVQRSGSEWKWKTAWSMKPSSFSKWKPDNVDSNINNCVTLLINEGSMLGREYYFWNAVSCTSVNNFLCQKPAKIVECMDSERRYTGTANVTTNGVPCLRWNNKDLLSTRLLFHAQKYWNHNYCRNPDKDYLPWCFTSMISTGYCDVPKCEDYDCDEGEMKCGNLEYCIPKEFFCDFENDCPNNFDEKNCDDCGRQPGRIPVRRVRDSDYEDLASLKPARIVGGFETVPGLYPWTASLRIKAKNFHHCGASIISQFFLLTAAHCFEKEKDWSKYSIVVGNWDNTYEETSEKSFDIEKVILYPGFKNLRNDDLALIKVKSSEGIPFTDYIQPICLPNFYSSLNATSKCIVTGWGSNGETPVKRMQAAELPLIPRSECSKPNVYGSSLSEKAFCAGFLDGGVDACVGDSGGPFACEIKSRYTLFGVVSWGEGCAERNKPGVYTMVKEYTNWIKEEMLKNS